MMRAVHRSLVQRVTARAWCLIMISRHTASTSVYLPHQIFFITLQIFCWVVPDGHCVQEVGEVHVEQQEHAPAVGVLKQI